MARARNKDNYPHSEVMTPSQVSFFLNIPLSTVYYFSKKGVLKSFRVGHKWRYRRADIEAYLLEGAPEEDDGREAERKDQREAIRLNTSIDCSFDITIPDRKKVTGKADILNISHNGVLLEVTGYESEDGLPSAGDPVNLHFKLNTVFAPPLSLEMKGRVSRIELDGAIKMAVRFRNVPKELKTKLMVYTGEKTS